ncbi:MAG: DUF6869 domain-containing protein [Candidatus Binatia bacterium]
MTESEKIRIVETWIAFQLAEKDSADYDANFWAWETMWNLSEENPDLCWELILNILATNDSTSVLEILSAGPLEDLLAKHGPAVRVELEARMNPRFASLLGGVWQNSMTDEVWNRVRAVWGPVPRV